MREVEQLTATNKLPELKELKMDFEEIQQQLSSLHFMGKLSEEVIWDNYKAVFAQVDAHDENEIVSFNAETK